jgi:hypothetical protein
VISPHKSGSSKSFSASLLSYEQTRQRFVLAPLFATQPAKLLAFVAEDDVGPKSGGHQWPSRISLASKNVSSCRLGCLFLQKKLA